MRISRREFVKSVTASGIALSLSRLAIAEEPSFAERETLPGRHRWNPAADGRGRIDAVPKVTGAKLYASDFRAADLPGWPQNTSHAMLIRAADATHVLTGMDLSPLAGALKPSVVVTAADLARIGARVPEYLCRRPLVPGGQDAALPGPAGGDVDLRGLRHVRSGAARAARPGCSEIRRGNRPGQNAELRRSFDSRGWPARPQTRPMSTRRSKNGWVRPGFFENSGAPIWPRLPVPSGAAYAVAASHGEKIRAELDAKNPALLVLDREFETQSVDPMFLEPESGLAWYDTGRKDLESGYRRAVALRDNDSDRVSARQCPGGLQAGAHQRQLRVLRRRIRRTRPHAVPALRRVGGDVLPESSRPARQQPLRAVSIGDQATRLQDAHADRGRSGDRQDRRICRRPVLDGGGLANFSGQVASVGALAALGIYDVPKVDVTTVALHSRGVTAGSMRCYGTLQTMTALEVLVDEICTALPLDPIEFRRRNALAAGGRTMAGNTYVVSIRTPEILDKLEKHPIWAQRAEEKARGQQSGILVGTGVACRHQELRHRRRRLRWHPSKSGPTAGLPSIATALRWATASERRWPIGSRRIWAASRTKSRSRKSTHSLRSIS